MGKPQNERVLQEFHKQRDKAMVYKNDNCLTLAERWDSFKISTLNTAAKVLDRAERKHQHWFDEDDAKLNALLDD